MIQIGKIYISKIQPVSSIPEKRNFWGFVTNVEEVDGFILIECDYGFKKGNPEHIFTDILSKKEYEEYSEIRTKECAHCHETKPLEEFYKSSSTSDGKQSWCKKCTKEYEKIRSPRRKRCSKCGKIKPSSEFYKATGRKDGLSSRCIECDKEHGRLHRKKTANNPDGYILSDTLLKNATESQLIEKLRRGGKYRITRIDTVEVETEL